MKKIILVLFILILLGGCGLSAWYYFTNQSSQNGLNLKLRAMGEYILTWNPTILDSEKTQYMWGCSTEQEFIDNFAMEMSAYDMIGSVLEIKDDFTAKLYTEGSDSVKSLYYILAKDKTRILFFNDENCTQKFKDKQALVSGITVKDGKYLHKHHTFYENDEVVFEFYVVYEQIK